MGLYISWLSVMVSLRGIMEMCSSIDIREVC